MPRFLVCLLMFIGLLRLGAGVLPLRTEVWEGQHGLTPETIVVVDDTTAEGTYAVTRDYLPLPEGDFCFGGWCSAENVTTDSKIYLRCYDAQGNRVGTLRTGGTTNSDWTLLEKVVPSADRPAGATQAKLLLQAATGSAEGMGTAQFRDIFLTKYQMPETPAGTLDWSDVTFFKTEGIRLRGIRKHCDFAWPEGGARLEISWAALHFPAYLCFLSLDARPGPVQVARWDDELQRYVDWRELSLENAENVWTLDLRGLPATRKVLLRFAAGMSVDTARFYIREAVQENWKASWIWFTAERVENLRCWLRREIELPETPVEAWIQCCADDTGEVFVNGQSIGSAGTWKSPAVREISAFLRPGRNVIAAVVRQNRYAAGLLAEVDCRFASGRECKFVTDREWQWTLEEPTDGWNLPDFVLKPETWRNALELFQPPQGDWGSVPYVMKEHRIPLELKEIPVPEKLSCATQYHWKFDIIGEVPQGFRPVQLVLSRGGVDFRRITLGALEQGGKTSFTVDWSPGEYLYPGTYQLALSVPGCEVVVDGKPFAREIVVENDRRPTPATSRVAPGPYGQTTLFVEGVPTMPYLSILFPGAENYPEARQSGEAKMRLVHVYGRLANRPDGNYDFSLVDNVIYTALRGNPEAYLLLRITFRDSVDAAFFANHPEEIVRLDNGQELRHQSFASKAWREAVRKMIVALVRHIQEGPYADRVVGFLPSEGEEGQWMHYWGGADPANEGTLTDYSPAMQSYFRDWLARKYRTDEALREAWAQPEATLTTAQIPTRTARVGLSEEGVFRKLPRDRAVVDYAEALSDVVADAIAEYTRTVKEASGGRLLTGILYGHIMDLGGSFMAEQVGYLKLRRVIANPDLDFVAGPISYWGQYRDFGGTGSFDYPTPATLRLHNKLWINEVDLRTHLLDSNDHVSDVTTSRRTLEVLAREFALSLCSNAGLWLCNLAGGQRAWFDDIETRRGMSAFQEIAEVAPMQDLRSTAEIAVVFCDRSLAYLRPLATNKPRTTDGIMESLMIWQRLALRRLGAPFDAYLADDFLNPNLPPYKLYVFMDTFYLNAADREAITRKLAADKAFALWFYAPGILDEQGFRPEAAGDLTGIPVVLENRREAAVMREAKTDKPLGVSEYSFLPAATPLVDEETAVLAHKADGVTPAVVRKGKNYYAAYAGLTPEFLRQIAREAGVFLYSLDDDAIYANASYLAVHTSKRPGPRAITLPPGVKAVPLWPDKAFAPLRGEVLRFDSTAPHTRIWRLIRNPLE